MAPRWLDVMAGANRYVLASSPYRADVTIPQPGQDEYGQPRQGTPIQYTDVPAWLASAPHQRLAATQRVETAGDWHLIYLHDETVATPPVPGTEITIHAVQDAEVVAMGAWVVVGEPTRQMGRWVVRVEPKR